MRASALRAENTDSGRDPGPYECAELDVGHATERPFVIASAERVIVTIDQAGCEAATSEIERLACEPCGVHTCRQAAFDRDDTLALDEDVDVPQRFWGVDLTIRDQGVAHPSPLNGRLPATCDRPCGPSTGRLARLTHLVQVWKSAEGAGAED